MHGSQEEFRDVPFFMTRQYGTELCFAGNVPKIRKVVFRGSLESGDFVAGYYRGKRLQGIAAVGRAREFLALVEILHTGKSLPPRAFRHESMDFEDILISYSKKS
jgi:3-phenylpropionate/trans-cinnamate dioxygenase ferredoxin reductase subunit